MMSQAGKAGQTEPRRLRVLHALAVSVPHLNGYAVRSRYLVENQQRTGVEPAVITSPFYPGLEAARRDEVRDGVPYLRVPHPVDEPGGTPGDRLARHFYRLRRTRPVALGRSLGRRLRRGIAMADAVARPGSGLQGSGSRGGGEASRPAVGGAGGRLRRFVKRVVFAVARPVLRGFDRLAPASRLAEGLEAAEERLLMRRFARRIAAEARRLESDLIHAHSPYRTALPAIAAGRCLGLPVVYELRGLWEESAVASGYFQAGDRRYRAWRGKEMRALAAADAVVCICESLRDEVVARGVPAEKVFVVPNAVDTEGFRPPAAEARRPAAVEPVAERLSGTVFGYVGSVRALEGVDELVRGVAELVRRGRDASLLVVGGGDLEVLRALAAELGLGERAVFPGAVPHAEVAAWYSLIDVFVISRPDVAVARLVTPLKPLEAMALERPLVVPDLPALRELVRDGETGLVYRPGDVGHLADQGQRLMDDPALRRRLADAARRWVERERTWTAAMAPLDDVYAEARRRAAGRSGSAG